MGSHLRRRVEPEDVLQEALVRAFHSIGGFSWKGDDSFIRWLGGIAENVILNLTKKHSPDQNLRLVRDVSSAEVSPSKAMRRDERFRHLENSLDDLSEAHRTVILLARIEGLPIREIAQRMERSETAVKNLLLRALKSLKSSFGDTESLGLPDRHLGTQEESDAE